MEIITNRDYASMFVVLIFLAITKALLELGTLEKG
jgi:hypothetical protein